MILWLERKEKLFSFSAQIERRLSDAAKDPQASHRSKLEASTYFGYHSITLAKTPSISNFTLMKFVQTYGIRQTDFERVLTSFVQMRQQYLRVPVRPTPPNLILSTWFRFNITNRQTAYLRSQVDDFQESVHASPHRQSQEGENAPPARYDTVLVNETWDGREEGLRGN